MKTKTDLRLQFHRETGRRSLIGELKEDGYVYLDKADVDYVNWLEERVIENEEC